MLENISFIASVISAITALTTSIRALGKAHENATYDLKSRISTGCRLSNSGTSHSFGRSDNLLTYVVSTIIWLALSIIFALPLLSTKLTDEFDSGMVVFLIPFIMLIVSISFIWKKIFYLKKSH